MVAAAGLTLVATTVFLGGFIIGEPPATRQPGPFLVGARGAIDQHPNLAAARFAAEHLPPESRVLADRPNATLLGSVGRLDPVFGQIDGIPITRVSLQRGVRADRPPRDRDDAIDYIAVDRRLSSRSAGSSATTWRAIEPGAFTRQRPLSAEALRKFDDVPGLSRVYDNGAIAIYDTSGLR